MDCPLSPTTTGIRLRLAQHNLERLDALTRAWGMAHRGEALDHLLEQVWDEPGCDAPASVEVAVVPSPQPRPVPSGSATSGLPDSPLQSTTNGRGVVDWLRGLGTRRR
jgi:hypothetical protein